MHLYVRFLPMILASAVASACAAAPPATPGVGVDEIAEWEAFCDELKATGVATLRDHEQEHEVDRAEGVRYLVQQLGVAVDLELEARETELPLMRLGATTIGKWGLDGADAKYQGAAVDGRGTYLLSGTLGNATLTAVQLSKMLPKYAAYESASSDDFQADPDGKFELLISNERPEDWTGAWLRLDPDATTLLVREYFGDWSDTQPATFHIERLDSVARPASLGTQDIRPMLRGISSAFEQRVPMWLDRSKQTRRFLTNSARQTSGDGESGQGLSDNVYGAGWFDVNDETVLVIEFEEPEALLWSIQVGNYWWESIDYVTGTGSLNAKQAFTNSDGKVRVVIALSDPGVPNWLDTDGHPEGMFIYRFQQATKSADPMVRVMPASELRAALPADTPSVSAEQRAAQIAVRKTHVAKRWAP
jgi:hypothetical protein